MSLSTVNKRRGAGVGMPQSPKKQSSSAMSKQTAEEPVVDGAATIVVGSSTDDIFAINSGDERM